MLESRAAFRKGGAVLGGLGLADRMLKCFLELVHLLRERIMVSEHFLVSV